MRVQYKDLVNCSDILGLCAWSNEEVTGVCVCVCLMDGQVVEQRMFYHHIKCIMNDEKTCRVCKKKIGNRSVQFFVSSSQSYHV